MVDRGFLCITLMPTAARALERYYLYCQRLALLTIQHRVQVHCHAAVAGIANA